MTHPLQAFRDRVERALTPFTLWSWKVGKERIRVHFLGEGHELKRFFLEETGTVAVLAELYVIIGGESPELPPRGSVKMLGTEDWVAVYHQGGEEAYVWLKSLDNVAAWGPETPLHVPLGWIAEQWGYALAHASAFGKDGKVALIVGPPGVGKSTLAVRAAIRGFEYYGDDRVLVEEWGYQVHAVFSSAKCFLKDITPEHAKFDTGLVVRDKAILEIPVCHKAGAIMAVVVPTKRPDHHPVGHGTVLWNSSRARALRALAPSSMLQLPGLGRRSLDAFSKVVQGSIPFELLWGSDVDLAIDRIAELF
jgi:hypothetical protein